MNRPNPTHPNIVYARINGRELALDLYLPENAPVPYSLIIWIHGGAWREGDRRWCDEALPLLSDGYAIASLDYRLSQESLFPAQIRDVKAATRWLRFHAAEYQLDPHRFASGGSSAGGHLAVMLGASFYKKAWDKHGEYTDCAPEEVSSAVQAVMDWYGPTDFQRMDDRPGVQVHLAPDSPESLLIGGTVSDNLEKAAAASPLTYLYPAFPPFLILHGDKDPVVIHEQSLILVEALKRRWHQPELALIEGAGHGFTGEDYRRALDLARDFLRRNLREADLPRNVYYACTPETFRPRTRHAVRWLNPFEDYALARAYWNLRPGNDLTEEMWRYAHEQGYSYAAVLQEDRIVSTAAVLRFSDAAWELAGVSTLEEGERGCGYAQSVCSFVTKYILGAGKIATTSTRMNNTAMQKTAESIGFLQV